jgi:hypothetical protein
MNDQPQKNAPAGIWWAAAFGLFPISLAMFWFGLEGAWTNQVEPILSWSTACVVILSLSPFVALAGVIWLVALIVLADRRHAARWDAERIRRLL